MAFLNPVPQLELAPGFSISRIIKGGWQLSQGHRAGLDADPVQDMIRFAESGITTFDCADIYTGVEELIGRFLKAYKAKHGNTHGIRILTKYVPDYDALATLDKRYTERIIDRSLRRLGVEQLDMVQFSWWSYEVPRYVEAAQHLRDLQLAGKINLISGTNFNTRATRKLIEAGIPIKTIQVQYSPLDNRPDRGLTKLCEENGMHLLCYGTVAGGFLSDRWLHQPEPQPPYANRSLVKYKLMIEEAGGWDRFQHLLQSLHSIAKGHGVSITNVVTAWLLSRPATGALIIGAATSDHLSSNLAGLHLQLTESEKQLIQSLATGPAGDPFDVERIKDGPHGSIMRYNLNQQAEDN